MSVAARYVNKELGAIFAVTLMMLLLVAVGGRFIGYLQEAAMGKYTGTTVLTIMYLRLPEFVQLVAPFALYVAVVLTMGRLYADQEMVVLQGAGTGTSRLLRWISPTAAAVVAIVALLSWYVTPLAQRSLTDFIAAQRAQSEFETVSPGTFHTYDRGRRVTYSKSISGDRKTLQDVFMVQRMDDGRQVTIWAESGTQQFDAVTRSPFLVLNRGRRYERTPGRTDMRVIEFEQLRQRLAAAQPRERSDVEAQSTTNLPGNGAGSAEWHWRVGLPLFCVIGGLMGFGISRVKPRQSRFARVVPGMLVMLLYYLGMLINKNAIAEEQVPQWLGLWLVHGVFFALALYFLSSLSRPVRA
jgi:lipopolysaccharide export system permease protein